MRFPRKFLMALAFGWHGVTGLPVQAAEETAQDLARATAPQDIAELLLRMSSVRTLTAQFSEQKKLALLRAPLTSTGTLSYLRPGRIVREVKSPVASVVRIGPGKLLMEDAQGKREISLQGAPGLQAFVESFSRVLQGDEQGLRLHYRLGFSHEKNEQWRLTLEPLATPLKSLIRRIEVAGKGQLVVRLTTVDAQGDTTSTTLTQAVVNHGFTPVQRRQLFGPLGDAGQSAASSSKP